jgi:hypothetical protein
MSNQEGDRDNPYSFDDYLLVRDNFDYYSDDEFLQKLVEYFVPKEEFEVVNRDLKALSNYISYKWRDLANQANELENRIKVTKVKHFKV